MFNFASSECLNLDTSRLFYLDSLTQLTTVAVVFLLLPVFAAA